MSRVDLLCQKGNCSKRSEEFRGLLALIAQRAREAGQALTLTGDMMAWPGAVHTLWTRLAASVPVEPRRTGCTQQSVLVEDRKSVMSVGWNKRYIIMRRSIRAIKGAEKNHGWRN